MALNSHCGVCGAQRVQTSSGKFLYCPPCGRRRNRDRRAQIREAYRSVTLVPVHVVGAKDRLRKYIDAHPDYAVKVILEFLSRSNYTEAEAA